MSVPERVAVVGDGSMGSTLAHVMAAGGHHCVLWCAAAETAHAIACEGRHPARPHLALSPGLVATASLADAVADASLVVVAVPSAVLRDVARALASLVSPAQVLLSATKGVDLPTLTFPSTVLAGTTGAAAVGIVAGPNITPEIMAGQVTSLLVASPSARARALGARVLRGPQLLVETSADLRSMEVASVLKNVVSIAVAMAAGGGMGFNAQGLLLARGLAEIEALGVELGARREAFRGPAGLGDVFLTVCSPQSLNRRLGMELGRGCPLDVVLRDLPEVPEGIGAVRAARRLARAFGMSLPVCGAAAAILEGEAPPSVLEAILMTPSAGMSE